jgi:hypothetical protein
MRVAPLLLSYPFVDSSEWIASGPVFGRSLFITFYTGTGRHSPPGLSRSYRHIASLAEKEAVFPDLDTVSGKELLCSCN